VSARDGLDRALQVARRATRFRWPMVAALLLGAAACVAIAIARPRAYRSETLIVYREGIRPGALLGGEASGESARKLGMKLREMVLSRTRLAGIIHDFHLYPDLLAARGEVNTIEEMRTHIAFVVRDGETFDLSYEGDDPNRVQAVTARLAEELIAENARTRLEQAALTRDFLSVEMQRNEGELRLKETALARFLAQHPEFAQEAGTAASGSAIRAAQAQRGSAPPIVDRDLVALERQAARLEQSLGVAPAVPRGVATSSDPKLVAAQSAAEAEVQAARRDLVEKLALFTPRHPDVRGSEARLRTAEARLKQAVAAVAASEERDPAPAAVASPADRTTRRQELGRVNAAIASYRARRLANRGSRVDLPPAASRIVALETEWTQLNREAAEAREQHQQLEDRKFNATMVASSLSTDGSAQMVVVDPAYVPTHPAPPGRFTIVAVGVAASFALAFALAIGCALFDDRLWDRSDVERMGAAPLLAVVPRHGATSPAADDEEGESRRQRVTVRKALAPSDLAIPEAHEAFPNIRVDRQQPRPEGPDPRLVLLSAPDSPEAASYRVLRHRLLDRGDPRVIAVTSADAGVGETTCAANLALALSEGGRARVLLFEANLRNPTLAPLFEVTPAACSSLQVDRQRDDPSEAWHVLEVAPGSLHVAAASADDVRPALDAPSFARAMKLLRSSRYDYIVLHAPPVLGSADMNLLEDAVDGVLITARAGKSSSRGLKRAIEQLPPSKVVGVMLIDS
jgi:protein tyrosine kinase modulator